MDKIFSINGPVVKVKDTKTFSMQEMVYVGSKRLIGEVIRVTSDFTTIQVYEGTTGLMPGGGAGREHGCSDERNARTGNT